MALATHNGCWSAAFLYKESSQPVSYTHLDVYKRQAIMLVFILTIIGGPIDLLIQDLIIGENGLQDIITQVSTTKNMIFGNILSQAR